MALSWMSEKGMNSHTSFIRQQYYSVSSRHAFMKKLENNNLTPDLQKLWNQTNQPNN